MFDTKGPVTVTGVARAAVVASCSHLTGAGDGVWCLDAEFDVGVLRAMAKSEAETFA